MWLIKNLVWLVVTWGHVPKWFALTYLQDLSHLFDWNTKQLFVMLIAYYKTSKNVSPSFATFGSCSLSLLLNRWSTRWCYGIRSFFVEIRLCWTSGIYPPSTTSLMMEEDSCEYQWCQFASGVSRCIAFCVWWFSGNKDVSLELNWNIIPHAGLLPMIRSGSASVPFPSSYSTTRQRKM